MDVPSSQLLTAPGASPTRWMTFLHGILGRGANWRGFARRLVERAPAWGAILVDLRAHGDSLELPEPDTVERCAQDLVRLEAKLGLPIAGALGHSFGGKVATMYALEARSIRQLFVIDSRLGATDGGADAIEASRVIAMLAAAPDRFRDRPAFLAHVREAGFDEALARWLAQSLAARPDGGFRFSLDTRRIRALMDDYASLDLWDAIDPPRAGLAVHLVIGGRSDTYGPAGIAKANDLAERNEAVFAHVIEDASHWVHVDAPDRLLDIVVEALA
ncbi:MAG: alpha/beta fold hydrolase [Sandaracinaceae bacterium]